ncbi:MAG: DinB family protein [Gemmatimonadetes bacterium]|nr:DinB family protein [Gemmatimonadota bacterium]
MHRTQRSTLVVALALLALAPRAGAQASGGDLMNATTTAEVRQRFLLDLDTLQAKFKALAEAIPAEKYTWRPAPGVRSVGEAFMHVASEYYFFTPMAYGLAPSPVIGRSEEAFKAFEAKSTKADVMKHLDEGFAFMRAAIAGADVNALSGTRKLFGGDRTIIETSFIMSGDLHEHLGQLIAYARAQGIKPPWSK